MICVIICLYKVKCCYNMFILIIKYSSALLLGVSEAIMDFNSEKFGEMLQYVRGEKIWSQEELAEKMNVSFATINRLEKGHHVPSFKTLSKFKQMCKAEGITFED